MAPSSSSTPSSTTAITLACSIHHRLRSAWERRKTRGSHHHHHHHHHHTKPSLPVSTNVFIVRTIIYNSNHFGLQYSSSAPLGLGKKKDSRLASSSSSSSSSHEALITGIYKRRHRPHHHLQQQSLWPAVFIIGSTQLRKEVKTIIIIIIITRLGITHHKLITRLVIFGRTLIINRVHCIILVSHCCCFRALFVLRFAVYGNGASSSLSSPSLSMLRHSKTPCHWHSLLLKETFVLRVGNPH
jgi:hypothetical protein